MLVYISPIVTKLESFMQLKLCKDVQKHTVNSQTLQVDTKCLG